MTKQCRVRLTAEPIYFWYPSVVPDGLGGKVLKRCSSSLIYIMQHIFELSFIKCAYPSVWKIGEIVPVGKKDIPQVDNDLRPVTLTNILSKCLGMSWFRPAHAVCERSYRPIAICLC